MLRKSWWNVRWRLGGLALGVAAATMVIAACASVTETSEEKVLRDGHTAAAQRTVYSPDGKRLVSVGEDKQVIVWDFAERERLVTFNDHTDWVAAVAFSFDGTHVVSAGDDKTIALWEVGSRRLVTHIGLHTSPVYAVAFSPDGQQLVSGEHDHSVRLYTQRRSLWGWRWE